MYQGRGKLSPIRRSAVQRSRPGSAKRVTGRLMKSVALTKASKTLSSVAIDASTQRANITVVVRVRPPNNHENTANARLVVNAIDSHMVVFDPPDEESPDFFYRGKKQNYQSKSRHKNVKLAFDNVYGPQSSNPDIFSDVIKPMLDTLLEGFNCSVFAYGATGSGKTHTMLGNMGNPGLTFLTVMELYERLGKMEAEFETEVAVSYLEVYNETVKDLLHSSGDLHLREDTHGVAVPNLTNHKPKNAKELLNLLSFGNSVRSQHPTDHNAESSRSHAVFQVYINLRSRFTELTNKYRSAKLVMVDLAGSERGTATGFQGQRFREGASINKSLLALGNCINALADGKKHIPYRDSKLSRILKDSLGGNCKTVMIANVSPSHLSYDDSYNTLRYADRAKRIKCQVKKNTMSVTACLTQYTKVVEEMSQKIDQLQRELAECKKTCNCKNLKVDVATEQDESLSDDTEQRGPWQKTPMLPADMIKMYSELVQRKQEALRILGSASATAATMATKIRVKERRIASIRKFSTGLSVERNTRKTRNQLEPLITRHKEALVKKSKALEVVYHLDQKWEELEAQNNFNMDTTFVPVKLSEFLDMQNKMVERQKLEWLKNFYKQSCRFFLEEWQKGETIVSNSVEFLASQYSLTKHFNANTLKMDHEYEALTGNLCGTHVRFPDDMDLNDPESCVAPLSTLLEEESLMEEDSCYYENAELQMTKKDENPRFRRPATPPRKKLTTNRELDITFDEPSELGSFASESSILNNIASYGSTSSMLPKLIDQSTSDDLDSTHLSVSRSQASNSSFLNGTITLDEPSSVTSKSPTYQKTSKTYRLEAGTLPTPVFYPSADQSYHHNEGQSDDSIEMNKDVQAPDLSESFAPVPCFLSDRSYLKLEIKDEGISPIKENISPVTVRRGEDVDISQDINSTFSVNGSFNQNATFDLGVGGGPKSQGPLFRSINTPANKAPMLSSNLTEDRVEFPKFPGFQSRPAIKKIPATTSKPLAKGRSPVAYTPSSLHSKQNKVVPAPLPNRNTSGQTKSANKETSGINNHSRWRP